MSLIRLTPTAHLIWDPETSIPSGTPDSTTAPGDPAGIRKSFMQDWREGLFRLSAEKITLTDLPADHAAVLRFWQQFADGYLTALSHIPESAPGIHVPPPNDAWLGGFILNAPPMTGGEYLSLPVLRAIWERLDAWTLERIGEAVNLPGFLKKQAPLWNQVGRVCFHLAENKNNPGQPFAFMAAYSSGFTADGKLKYLPLHRALTVYAGKSNRQTLINLLTPVHRAATQCSWVDRLVRSNDIYHPMHWSAAEAYEFLQTSPLLESCGIALRLPDWWKKHQKARVTVTIGEKKKARFGIDTLLDFDLKMMVADQALSEEEIRRLLEGNDGLVFMKGQWVEVDRERLQQALEHWEKVRRAAENGVISFHEGMRLLAGAPGDLNIRDDADGDESLREWSRVMPGSALRDILESLRTPSALAAIEPSDTMRATLRPYQKEGVSWLVFLGGLGLGACLADDMGLGKTVQVLAMLEHHRRNRNGDPPSLLVIPASLLGNWRQEALRFTPALSLLFLHASEMDRETLSQWENGPRKAAGTGGVGKQAGSEVDPWWPGPGGELARTDLVVTTYAMLKRFEWMTDFPWRAAILDEAQAIRNASTRQSRIARRLKAGARIALTGTPIENRLTDLWTIFDFLNPGLLGSVNTFKAFVEGLESRRSEQFAPLRRLTEPYILRRMKTDRRIISDLPDKTEMKRYCLLAKKQVALYEKIVRQLENFLADASGIERRGLVLQALMRLKQVCNHPAQMLGDADYSPEFSGKFEALADICGELAERQEKVLIFTQFQEIIDPLADYLAGVFGRPGVVLHGKTSIPERKRRIDLFQSETGPPFFILSIKAGGTGLNLTAASHVIHFDRWWNPAVENQATDRAFRIGQKKNVIVHKFVTRGTIEEHIDALIEDKKHLAAEVLASGGEIRVTEMSDEALLKLVRLDISGVVE